MANPVSWYSCVGFGVGNVRGKEVSCLSVPEANAETLKVNEIEQRVACSYPHQRTDLSYQSLVDQRLSEK